MIPVIPRLDMQIALTGNHIPDLNDANAPGPTVEVEYPKRLFLAQRICVWSDVHDCFPSPLELDVAFMTSLQTVSVQDREL